MSLSFARWPFLHSRARSSEENERWWKDCYVSNGTEGMLRGKAWCALTGPYGSGKSTTLAAVSRSHESALIIDYFPAAWSASLREEQKNHLYQIMALSSYVIRRYLTDHPDKLSTLSKSMREYLRWLIEKFNDPRAYIRWLDGVPPETEQNFRDIEYQDLYPTQTETLDVQGQIEELVNLVRRLGFQQLLVLADTDAILTSIQIDKVGNLLGWLELMHHDGLNFIVSLSPLCEDLIERSRGRLGLVEMMTSKEHTREVINRHIHVATDGKLISMEQIASADLLALLSPMIENEYGEAALGAWVSVTKILLELAQKGGLPVTETSYDEVRNTFFSQCLPLRLDPGSDRHGVWRGHKWIQLDMSVFDFLKTLWRFRGQPIDGSQLVAHISTENLHTLARRLRVAIEPDASQPIYLKSRRAEGYWLENSIMETK